MSVDIIGHQWEKTWSGICEPQRCRPACASAQTDQCLFYSLTGKYHIGTTLQERPWLDIKQKRRTLQYKQRSSPNFKHISFLVNSFRIHDSPTQFLLSLRLCLTEFVTVMWLPAVDSLQVNAQISFLCRNIYWGSFYHFHRQMKSNSI